MAAVLISFLAIESSQWMAAILVALAAVVAVRSDGAKSRVAPALLALVALGVALLPLFGYWFAGRTHPNAIAGVLPWNDAAGYYGCALSVLDGEGLHVFCQRRPAYSVYLAGLLRAAGSELQLALVLQAVVNGAAMFAAAYAAMQRWGAASGLIVLAVLAPFAAVTSQATLTENLGFVLGGASLLLFLSGAERRSAGLLAAGMFVLSVALNARAGAFLVIPLLMLWPLLIADMPRGKRWRLVGILVIAGAAGFVPGPVLVTMLGGPVSEIHSNFSYTLYGLAAGGERWTVTLVDLPGATSDEIYQAAFARILAQPDLLLIGLMQGFLEYLQRLLIYIPWIPVRVILGAFWLMGIASVLRPRSGDCDRVIALIILGVALSAPVLSIDGDTRVYAATVTVDGLLAALGFAGLVAGIASVAHRMRTVLWAAAVLMILAVPQVFAVGDPRAWGGAMVLGGLVALLAEWLNADRSSVVPRRVASAVPALAMAVAVTLIAFIVPWFWPRSLGPVTYPVATDCPVGEPIIARFGLDSPVIKIGGPNRPRDHWPVVSPRGSFRAELDTLTHRYADFAALPAETAVVFAYDRKPLPEFSVRSSLLVGPADLIPADGGLYQACVSDELKSGLSDARRVLSVRRIAATPAAPR